MQHFQSELDTLQKKWSNEPQALSSLRTDAFSRFTELGFPTKKWEDWQFTDFSPFEKIEYQMGKQKEINPDDYLIQESLKEVYSIVILNGQFLPEQSKIPKGVFIQTLLDLFLKNAQIEDNRNPFFALNTSLMNSGLSVHIPDGLHVDKPIHLLSLTTGLLSPTMNHPRLVIKIGNNSSATILEQYTGRRNTQYWNNCVTIIDVGKSSVFHHYRLQEDTGYHTETLDYHIEKDASLNVVQFNKDTELYRGDLYLHYGGQNASAQLNGLSLLNMNQHMDTRVIVNHNQPNCQSHQFFKYILDDKAAGVFNGRVVVEKDSHKTDSSQSNKNLLLSSSSSMHSNPQLEIYADDVRCSHGSSTGQMNEDALYYLRSRGIDVNTAQMLMVEGFAGEVLSLIKDKTISTYFGSKLSRWLEELSHE